MSPQSKWAGTFDPRPAAHLYRSWDGVPAIGIWLAMGFGLACVGGWIGPLGAGSGPSRGGLGFHLPSFLAWAVVTGPGIAGVLFGHDIEKVLKRPLTFLLPNVRAGLRAFAAVLGIAVAVVSASLGALSTEIVLHRALALASISFALGLWLPVRRGGAQSLLAAACALGLVLGSHRFLKHGLAAVGSPFESLLLVALAAALFHRRFAASVARATFDRPVWAARGVWNQEATAETWNRRVAARSAPRFNRMPARRLGGNVSGWIAARRFELQAASGMGRYGMVMLMASWIGLFHLLLHFVAGWMGSAESGAGPLQRGLGLAMDALTGRASTAVLGNSFILPSVFGFFAALLGSETFAHPFSRPLGRAMHARVAFRVAVGSALSFGICTLVVCALLVFGLGAMTGKALPEGVPYYLVVVLVVVSGLPWFIMLIYQLRNTKVGAIGAASSACCLALLPDRIAMESLAHPTTGTLLAYAALTALGWAGLAFYLRHYFLTRDLPV